jgi:hypothetical protein
MSTRRILPFVFFALISGCTVTARPVYVARTAPPAPRYVQVRERTGLVWIDGNWQMVGGHWVWHEGRYVRERPGYSWEQGVWIERGGQYHWRPGHWSRGERRVRVRDHRYY